jgi:hypothetical protein
MDKIIFILTKIYKKLKLQILSIKKVDKFIEKLMIK